jgi:broad specificity phosphatase PhoE
MDSRGLTMSIIYLARHASPDRSRTDLPYHLLPGPPLTEQGILEARELGCFFLNAGVRSIITSPLERCLHTARIAAGIAGIPLSIEPALIEWHPDEKTVDVLERTRPVISAAYQASLGNAPIALLSHGGPIGVMLQELGMTGEALTRQRVYDYGNPLPPAAAWLAERNEEDQTWKLRLAFVPSKKPLPVSNPFFGPEGNSQN